MRRDSYYANIKYFKLMKFMLKPSILILNINIRNCHDV